MMNDERERESDTLTKHWMWFFSSDECCYIDVDENVSNELMMKKWMICEKFLSYTLFNMKNGWYVKCFVIMHWNNFSEYVKENLTHEWKTKWLACPKNNVNKMMTIEADNFYF